MALCESHYTTGGHNILSYLELHYLAILFAVAAAPYFFHAGDRVDRPEMRAAVAIALSGVFLLATLRTTGPDLATYRYAYETNHTVIPDRGYQMMMEFGQLVGIPFNGFLFLMGLVSLLALKRLSGYFGVSYGLLLLFWLAHLAVGREITQLRVGFAIAIVSIAVTIRPSWLRVPVYVLGASVHLSVVALIGAYEASRLIARLSTNRLRVLGTIAVAGGIIGAGQLLSYLAFIDPRIAIYIEWEQELYGAAVENYTTLALHGFVLILAVFGRSAWLHSEKLFTLFLLQLFGVVTFIAFSETAIFAYRLSNVVLSFYPILLLYSLSALPLRFNGRPVNKLAAAVIVCLLVLVFVTRPGPMNDIAQISFN